MLSVTVAISRSSNPSVAGLFPSISMRTCLPINFFRKNSLASAVNGDCFGSEGLSFHDLVSNNNRRYKDRRKIVVQLTLAVGHSIN